MGLWVQFVIGRSAQPLGLPDSSERGVFDGWAYAELVGETGLEVIEQLAAKGTAALGGYVADSDAAAIVWCAPSAEADWLAINRSYDDSDEDHDELWLDLDRHRAACDALAAFSELTPRRTTGDELAGKITAVVDVEASEELEERRLLFCEDAVRVVLEDCLGFRSLDETVFDDSGDA